MVALPDTTLHVPLPIAGSVAPIVKTPSLHCSWSMPATAAEGSCWLVSTISEVLSAHTPLSIVQRSVAEVPAGTPVMVVVGEVGLVIVAVPETTLHVPSPTIGVLALMIKVPLL